MMLRYKGGSEFRVLAHRMSHDPAHITETCQPLAVVEE